MAWTEADLVTIGYFAVRPRLSTPAFGPVQYLVCGPSNCVAEEPENWIDRWLHNELWLFDDLPRVRSVLPPDTADEFVLLGLRSLPVQFGTRPNTLPPQWDVANVHPAPIPAHYVRLGYDVCCRSAQSSLECSPIVCNGFAERLGANRFCLLDSLEQAIAAAELFDQGGAEPGPYVVLEVWAERLPSADQNTRSNDVPFHLNTPFPASHRSPRRSV